MFSFKLLRGASAAAIVLALSTSASLAQQSLPTIEIGAASTRATRSTTAARPNANASRAAPGTPAPPAGPVAAKAIPENNTTYNPGESTTALKTRTPIMETPASVQVVPRAVLNDRQVTQISEAINNVSGVVAADERQSLVPAYYIRGFLTNTYYMDGIRMPASPTNTNQPFAGIDRVEVLKGPGSILFGRGDPGGIVNLITKKPLETPFNEVQQQIGSWGLYRTTFDSTGPITSDKSLLYRVNISYENYHDFVDFNHGTNIYVAPRVRWNIDQHTYADFYMSYQHRGSPFAGPPPAFTGPGPLSQDPLYAILFGTAGAPASLLPRSVSAYPAWSRTGSDEIIAGYSFNRDLNENWNLKHRFQAQLTDFTETFGGPFGYNGADGTLLDQFATYIPNIATHSYYTDATLTGNVSTFIADHTLLFGADYQHFDSNHWTYNGGLPSASFLYSNRTPFDPSIFMSTPSFAGYHENWWGAYVQDQIKLPYGISIVAGARYDKINQYDDSSQTVVTDMQRVTPRFGLLWRPMPQFSVYGSYTTSLGAPPLVSSKPLKPETAKQWEVGVKTELLDKRLIASVAYFDLTKNNIATVDPADPTGLNYIAIGQARNRGVEFDVSGELAPGWRVIGSYAYVASVITKDAHCDPNAWADFLITFAPYPSPSGCVADNYNTWYLGNPVLLSAVGNEGKRLGGVPRHAGSLWTTYEVQDGDFRGLKFGGGILARSLAQGDNFNSFHLPGYATINLMASYETRLLDHKTTFQVNLNNLLDTRYYTESYPSPFAVLTGTPRSLRGSIKVEF